MKIYQAIKYKKKLQSEISELWNRFTQNNSIIKGNTRNYDPSEVLKEIRMKTDELVNLKVALQKANKPIYSTIFNLAELKSLASYIKNTNTTSGITNRYDDVQIEYEAQFSKNDIDNLVKVTQEEIGRLQEELDQFNYKTEIKL